MYTIDRWPSNQHPSLIFQLKISLYHYSVCWAWSSTHIQTTGDTGVATGTERVAGIWENIQEEKGGREG